MTNSIMIEELIKSSGLKKGYIAKSLFISRQSLINKISNKNEFKPSEIEGMCKLLKITNPKLKEKIFY